jgi:hypothetical protein
MPLCFSLHERNRHCLLDVHLELFIYEKKINNGEEEESEKKKKKNT